MSSGVSMMSLFMVLCCRDYPPGAGLKGLELTKKLADVPQGKNCCKLVADFISGGVAKGGFNDATTETCVGNEKFAHFSVAHVGGQLIDFLAGDFLEVHDV